MLTTNLKRLFLAQTSIEEQLYPALAVPVRFRTLAPGDREACLSIYQQNETDRFPPSARKKFKASLENESKNYVVAELDSRVIGFGGVHLVGPEAAVLFYGMVTPEHQRKRIGANLILLRLAQLPAKPAGYFVFIFAVDPSMEVYQRFGFIRTQGGWTDDEKKTHPIGVLRVSSPTLEKIKSTLARRGIRLEGQLSLQPPRRTTFNIESTSAGLRFDFKPVGTENGVGRGKENSA
jgi:ribosomal-protein-alanine N-acetyltransferase